MDKILLLSLVITVVLCIISNDYRIDAYPILIDVHDNPEQKLCVSLEIPDADDVHLVLSNLPQEADAKLETWIMNEMSAIADRDSDKYLKMFTHPPHELQTLVNEGHHSNDVIDIEINGPNHSFKKKSIPSYQIVTLKNVASDMAHRNAGSPQYDDWSPDDGIYEICIESYSIRQGMGYVALEYVVIDEFEEKMRNKHALKTEHITPIETAFEQSIVTATAIINEMSGLERREKRMRHTSDSVLKRIQHFSYVSIVILLGVTWLQITYLKGYFKKKKVL